MKTQPMTFRMSSWSILAAALLLVGGLGACSSETSGSGPTNTAQGGNGAGGGTGATGTTTTTNLSADDDGDGYTVGQGDCDDHNPNVHPGVPEICDNGIDDNCNGATDTSEPDADGDGYGPCQGDCDDTNPNISPSQPEVPDDGIDNNCDGVTDGDYDGDGYTVADGDCNDNDPAIHPGAAENCFDGIDNNCNGFTDAAEPDADQDGYGPCQGDCDDTNPNVNPGMPEIPNNGIDDNCDNLVDEDIDGDGWTVANGDCDDTNPNVNPAMLEICNNNIDDDCDGVTDSDCVTPCQMAELLRSSVGCTYYAVDTNPIQAMVGQNWAVAVSNVDTSITAHVVIEQKTGNNWAAIYNFNVGPLSLQTQVLPHRYIDGSNIYAGGGYRITSDLPVIAYQFNPIDGSVSYLSDASLLLPTSTYDEYYITPGYTYGPDIGGSNWPVHLQIVASQDATQVWVTPSGATVAGGVPAMQVNVESAPITLNQGDYLQVTLSTVGQSFAGSYVRADKPIGVFSSADCSNVPYGSQNCCCEHLEEQIFGLQTWGMHYVGGRTVLIAAEPTLWQILAQQDNTTVTFSENAQITGLPATVTLNARQKAEYLVYGTAANPGDFYATADKPILITQFTVGSFLGNSSLGDPDMIQAVPVEQYLSRYVILVPTTWVNDTVTLTRVAGQSVTIDGVPVTTGWVAADNSGYEVTRAAVADGVHVVEGAQPFGIIIDGYDQYDSYAYPGGLNQQIINPIN